MRTGTALLETLLLCLGGLANCLLGKVTASMEQKGTQRARRAHYAPTGSPAPHPATCPARLGFMWSAVGGSPRASHDSHSPG